MDDAPRTRLLTRRDIAALMRPADYNAAVARAFMAAARGEGDTPAPMHLPAPEGGFHVKAAAFPPGCLTDGPRAYAAFKVNGNFPGNPSRRGLPTIQGALVLCDGRTGELLALMDSIEVTLRRTAAATAVAARALARPDASTLALCGCGEQGRAQVEALAEVLPLRRVRLWDREPARAAALAARIARPGLVVEVAANLAAATRDAQVIVTCTTATTAFLTPDLVAPGAFVAAVGADNPDKSEIAPALMARAAVVTDSTAQCLAMGDLRHAVAAGVPVEVRAELGEVLARLRPGRRDADEIIVFDSTGSALQDVASAAAIHERACAAGAGLELALGAPS